MTPPSPATPVSHTKRNLVANIMLETEDDSDNLAIALCSYFERHMHRPEDDPIDDELGWGKWALEKTNAALDLIAEEVFDPKAETREREFTRVTDGIAELRAKADRLERENGRLLAVIRERVEAKREYDTTPGVTCLRCGLADKALSEALAES